MSGTGHPRWAVVSRPSVCERYLLDCQTARWAALLASLTEPAGRSDRRADG